MEILWSFILSGNNDPSETVVDTVAGKQLIEIVEQKVKVSYMQFAAQPEKMRTNWLRRSQLESEREEAELCRKNKYSFYNNKKKNWFITAWKRIMSARAYLLAWKRSFENFDQWRTGKGVWSDKQKVKSIRSSSSWQRKSRIQAKDKETSV